ncbi:MAG: FtsK/SpoIIIE domain-containing protein [Acidimicrobiales bacterium]
MRLKLSLDRTAGATVDVSVVTEPTTTVGDLAGALAQRDPESNSPTGRSTLILKDGPQAGSPMLADLSLLEAGIRSGASVKIAADTMGDGSSGGGVGSGVATLRIVGGPDVGREFSLPLGTAYIGRGSSCDVILSDPLVSKRHAKLHVTTVAELIDTNSSNGILVGGEQVPRVIMNSEDVAVLGDTEVMIATHGTFTPGDVSQGTSLAFNRSPRLDPSFQGEEFVSPELPEPPVPQRFPITPLVVPVIMAAVLYLVTKNTLSIAFVALSPLMMLGNYFEGNRTKDRVLRQEIATFEASVAQLEEDLAASALTEASIRRAEYPAIAEVVEAVERLQPLVWARRPEQERFLEVRLGLGTRPSRSSLLMPNRVARGEYLSQLVALRGRFANIDGVPVVADLTSTPLGIAGDDGLAAEVAAAIMMQITALHSPAEVVVASVASPPSASQWEWLKWLPHVSSPGSPISGEHLAASPASCLNLVAMIEELIDQRSANSEGQSSSTDGGWVVLLVNDDAPVDRSRLTEIAHRGPSRRVAVVWCAPSVERLPASCRDYVEVDRIAGKVRAVLLDERREVTLSDVERLDAATSLHGARVMAPMVDAGARADDASDLPRSVSFVSLAGNDLAHSPESVLERWTETGSIVDRRADAPRRRTKEGGLRALIGRSATEPCFLDLRTHGPHALVGGTTGSGKSEFLQSWILGMATAYSPDRINFLLVDYKGGSAFGECRDLPHTVGMVTDLSIELARRALISLAAELKYREQVLNHKKAKDLVELERRGDPDAPPSLVIVIDEFAALVQELPEFVDGVVNVAQRGRSLGLHLILATQRPTGVVTGNLRANTNLRIALRMADEMDSDDVVGSSDAAAFDPSIPGRALAKLGPGRLVPFQAAYVGGTTSEVEPPPIIVIEDLVFGNPRLWEEPEESNAAEPQEDAVTDIHRLVRTVRAAADLGEIPAPRRPWLEDLAPVYNLRHLHTARLDSELVFGVHDDPENQSQPMARFLPDRDGNMLIYGSSGSGKSTTLRTMAVAAGLSVRGGPCWVYGMDFSSRGLGLLEELPHVGAIVDGDDTERIGRLLNRLRDTIDSRAVEYARVQAGSITEYRRNAEAPDEPRIILLVDGVGLFRQSAEAGDRARLFEVFSSIALDGRGVGVHVVATADRPSSVPASLASTMQHKLVLRLSSENDLSGLSIPKSFFDADTPPGRGFEWGKKVQVAVFGGSPNLADQADALGRLGETMRRNLSVEAPDVKRLPELVELQSLPETISGQPVLGMDSETLLPAAFDARGGFLVSGPTGSGRTSALVTLAHAIHRFDQGGELVFIGQQSGRLSDLQFWTQKAMDLDSIAAIAGQLVEQIGKGEFVGKRLTVVVESIGDLLGTVADGPLQQLAKAMTGPGLFIAADGDPSTLGGSSATLQVLKTSKSGMALQPDQSEGSNVFRVQFPRVNRAQFPVGRGLMVAQGECRVVQVAFVE